MNTSEAEKIKKLLIGAFLLGIGYSLLLVISGPHFIHFLAVPTVVHSLYYGTFFSVLLAALIWFGGGSNEKLLIRIFSSIWSIHFIIWLFYFSRIVRFPVWGEVVGYGLGGIILLGSFYAAPFVVDLGKNIIIAVLLIISILIIKLSLSFVPASHVGPTVVMHQKKPVQPGFVQNVLYPGAMGMEEVVQKFDPFFNFGNQGKRIIVLVLDAFREDFFGRTLSGVNVTPNLSELAERYSYFPRYRVQAPRSKASVASFFTGKYPRNHGTYDFGLVQELTDASLPDPGKAGVEDYYGHALPDKFTTLAERLRKGGFHNTGVVTIGHLLRRYNYGQGFHHYEDAPWPDVEQDLYVVRRFLFELLRQRSTSSFYYLHFAGAHFPYVQGKNNTRFWRQTAYFKQGGIEFDQWGLDPLEEIIQTKRSPDIRKRHSQEMLFLDHLYGSSIHYYDLFILPKLIKSLRSLDAFKETFFVVTSDHGENLFDSEGFYGHGHTLHDHTLNVPLLVKLPASLSKKKNLPELEDVTVESLDLTATLLDFANASLVGIQGKSFLPLLTESGDTDAFRTSFSEVLGRGRVIKSSVSYDDCKYIFNFQKDQGDYEFLCEDETYRKERNMRELMSEVLGPGNTLNDTSANYVGISERHLRQLKALGYF